MGKLNVPDKKYKVIDTVEYNGRYKNVSTYKTKLIAAGLIVAAACAVICVQFFLF
jgi:hypothetical protein